MTIFAQTFLPDGQLVSMPVQPRTWVDEAPGVVGSPLRAPYLEFDAGASIAWHRQRPLFQGIATGAQSIPNATFTAITGLTELIDNYAGHSDTTNTGRWFAPDTTSDSGVGDWYLCSGYIPFNSTDAAHPFTAAFRKNGGGTVLECGKVPSGSSHVVDVMAIDLIQLSGQAGDFVELMARQITGAAVNTSVSSKSPSFTVRWVCANPAWSGAATPALPATPHTWLTSDRATADLTGVVGGHSLVPLNRELRDAVSFLNNPPIARLTSEGTTQTVPSGSGTWTSIQFPAETVDNYSGHDNATNNSRYTCQRAGLYLVAGLVAVAEPGTNAGYRAARLQQTFAAGGSQTYAGWTTLPQTSGTTGSSIYAVGLVRMAAGDFVETQIQHTQGAALSVNSNAGNASKMIIVWMAQ